MKIYCNLCGKMELIKGNYSKRFCSPTCAVKFNRKKKVRHNKIESNRKLLEKEKASQLKRKEGWSSKQ